MAIHCLVFSDAVSVAISERPVWIALRITDPTQYSGNSPELPSIQQIELTDVTCSYTWLCSLLSMLLTLDHKVKCSLNDCEITSDVGGAVSPLFKTGHLEIQTENTKIALSVRNTSLWEALHGLNIKSLRLEGRYKAFRENHKELIDQTLSLLFKLDTLRITEEHDTPDLWQTLHGLNIKILSLSIVGRIKHTESLAQSLASLKQLDMLSIEVNYDRRGLWEALHGLSIKSLSMRLICKDGCFKLNYAESMKQSLSSLTQLETLIVSVTYYIPGLWGSLYGLNIKKLILNGGWRGLSLEHAESLSQSLSSHKHLIILSIELDYDRPELWDALNGLSMKRLSLSGKRRGLKLLYAESMKKSLLSLKQLESLIISGFEDCPGLWEAFSGLSIRHLSLLAGLGSYRVDHNGASKSLLSLTHLETLIISEDDKSPGVWQALRFLNIKSLSLYGCNDRGFRVNDTTSLSQSLSSLTHLEKLTLYVFTSIGLQLPQSLKYLNIYCETMPPSKLRDILDTLSACKHAIEIRLECGCASSVDPPERVQLQEYHSSQLEIAARNNVAIKRFRIYEWHYSAGSDMYIHNVCDVDDASQDDCSVKDDAYEHFAKRMKDLKFSRISIRLQTPVAK
ncbi:hypothetical protein DPMN_194736 [Dreissena polymorpha]|uniref:Uncharacterized protein n=1 Tax=Dreissena polymorpha TaxID=45954 RepID=A0A9D3Y3D4_DREPO|nr:hypothetical protein DPMN_194736 [Dreissena polymorpha]